MSCLTLRLAVSGFTILFSSFFSELKRLTRVCNVDCFFFVAHLSRRLIVEIVYPSASIRRSQCSNISSPKPLGQSMPTFMWSLLE